MSTILIDGVVIAASSEIQSALTRSSQISIPRTITSAAFLALWTAAEVASAAAADPALFYGMLRVATQGQVNLDSVDLQPLLDLAVSKGGLTAARAAQIRAGTGPA